MQARDPLVHPFLARCAQHSSRVVALARGRTLTAGELAARARDAARRVAALCLPEGAVVGLSAPPGPVFLAAYLGLRAERLVALWLDTSTPDGERERVLAHLGAAADWRIASAWPADDAPGTLERRAPGDLRVVPDCAVLKLTSGSSGAPSGIACSARSLAADGWALARSMGFTADDRFVASIPMSHSYGFSVLAMPVLLAGGTLVVPDEEDPLDVAELLGGTVLPSVPSWYQAQLERTDRARWPASLRLMLSAGAPLPPEVAREFRARHQRGVHVLYGSSECGGITYDRRGDAAERGRVGTPVLGVELELVHDEAGEDARGVVAVRSPAVATGYLPEDVADPARLSGGRFVSDDFASLEDGELTLHGRRSDWIDVKGLKVDPREVAAVIRELPPVDEVVVLGQPRPDGRCEVVRAVVASARPDLSYRDIVAWCRTRLSAHKIPRSVIIVPRIPRTERGKLDRAALLALESPS